MEHQNKEMTREMKIHEIINTLIRKTEANEVYWEKTGENDCYILDIGSGTFVIARYVKNEGNKQKRYIGYKLVSNSNVIYHEDELQEGALEFPKFNDFYEKIEDTTINNFFDSVLEDVNEFNDTIGDNKGTSIEDI
jgi:hypothetical protein